MSQKGEQKADKSKVDILVSHENETRRLSCARDFDSLSNAATGSFYELTSELGEKVTSSNLDSLLGPPTQRSLVRFKLSKKSARPDDGGGGAAGRSLAFRRSRSPVRTRSPMGTARRPRRGDTANASPHGRKFVGRPLSSVKETVGNNSGSNLAGLNRNSARSLSAVHSEQGIDILDRFLEAIRHIAAELEADKAAEKIIDETCKLLNADRATLFFVDDVANELILLVAKGAKSIRLPMGSGIAGHVAQCGETMNIKDAYKEKMFNDSFDKKTGYRTKSILATPVKDYDGEIVAVLQVINKNGTDQGFSQVDETLIENLSSHVGVTLRNAQYYQQAASSRRQVSSLTYIIQQLHSEPNTQSLIYTINQHIPDLLDAELSQVFVVDRARGNLILHQADVAKEMRYPLDTGLAGWVAKSGELVNLADAYSDPRFSSELDEELGFKTKSIICVPIKDSEHGVVGVLQVLNKVDDVFLEEDEQILETLMTIAGSILAKDSLFQRQVKPSEIGAAADLDIVPHGKPLRGRHQRQSSGSTTPLMQSALEEIVEEDEEEME